jgi:pilus assembly protein Flp/PilA
MRKFFADESGASLVEYGLLVGLISVVAIAAIQALGGKINALFVEVNSTLGEAGLGR